MSSANICTRGRLADDPSPFAELTSRDHSATQVFLYNRTLFQGQHLPPSNAVLPAAPHQGYWAARKGRTTFPFSFRLPASTPSSVVFAGNAAVRYVVKGLVQAWYQDAKSVVVTKSEANVVERWEDEDLPLYKTPVESVGETKLFMGGSGSVWVEAGVEQRLFMAGGKAMIRLGVRNASKRETSGVIVHVVRSLTVGEGGGPTITDVVHSQHYRGQAFEFPSGTEVVLNVPIDIPQETRTVRKTKLFQVNIGLVVSLPMGTFAKDLDVKLPVFAAHPTSLQHAWDGTMNDVHRLDPQEQQWAHEHENAALHHHQHAHHHAHHGAMPLPPRSQSAMGHHGSHVAFPASPADRAFTPGPPASPAIHYPGMVSLPQSPLPFSIAPSGQQQQISWDSNAQGWGASQFVAPQMPVSRPSSAQPDMQHCQDNANQVFATIPSPQAPQHVPLRAATVEPPATQLAMPVHEGYAPSPFSPGLAPPSPQDGLSTIAEDSESAANTVKSVWALGGDRTGAKRSVSPAEVELFERLVNGEGTQEEEPAAPPATLKNAGRTSVVDVFEAAKAAPPAPPPVAKSAVAPTTPPKEVTTMAKLPKATTPSSPKAEISKPLAKSPRASATASPPPAAAPERPGSAQGQGLTALEQRLASAKIAAVPASSSSTQAPSKDSQAAAAEASSSSKTKATGLRAAAAVRQQQSQSSVSVSPTVPSKTLPAAAPAPKTAPSTSSATSSERKVVNDGEARQLGKAAVGRVGGWLDETKGKEDASNLRSPLAASSAIDTPKTPSPSALMGDRGALDASSIALGGGSLRRSALAQSQNSRASEVVGGSAAASLTRSSSGLEALNRYRQAARNGSTSKDESSSSAATPKKSSTTAVAAATPPAPSVTKSTGADSSASSVKVAPVFSRNVGPSPQQAKNEQNTTTTTTDTSDSVTPRSYDVRSARGGKGGRVASAASLWASIANGMDGKLPSSGSASSSLQVVNTSMRRTTVNARPQARRSMNGEAPPLDFTNREKVEEEIERQEEEEEEAKSKRLSATSAAASSPTRVSPKALRPIAKPAANAMPSAFAGAGGKLTKSSPMTTGGNGASPSATASEDDVPHQLPKITKRGAAPFLNTTAPKGHISAAALSVPSVMGTAEEISVSMGGRGTTKPVGKQRLDELRSMFAASSS